MSPADLKALATVMTEMRIARVSMPHVASGVGGITSGLMEIELHPSAFGVPDDGPAVVPPDLGAGEPKCPCGHLRDSEHQNGMCIAAACPVSVCHPEATPKPPAV